jgi:hypothetical protein
MTPTINSTETKDLKTPAVNNNEVSHDVATHPVLEAELPSLPHVCVQPNSMAKRGNMIPPIRDTLGIPRSPTDIEVIDLTIDRSENSSDEPPKKKGKTTTIDVMVIVTMPGLVDPVVKKFSVRSTQNLIEIQNMLKYSTLFTSSSKCVSVSFVCTVLYVIMRVTLLEL